MTALEIKHFCFNCNTLQSEPIGPEGVCDKCLAEQEWFKEEVYTVEPPRHKAEHRVTIVSDGWILKTGDKTEHIRR